MRKTGYNHYVKDYFNQIISNMEIVAVRSSTILSDRRVRKEYLLSSPVTQEVLVAFSKGDYTFTGYQYLSPAYTIIKTDQIRISGILESPVISVDSMPGMSTGIEDYLSGYLSLIPDSERPDTLFQRMWRWARQTLLVKRFRFRYL